MRTLRNLGVLFLVCVLVGSCQVLSFSWIVPSQATVGSTFVMQLTGVTDSAFGAVGAVVQVPNGFEVLGAAATAFPSSGAHVALTRDDPALLAIYAAEPGHHLASFSGAAQIPKALAISATMKIYVRAPSVSGSHQIKLALASQVSSGFVPQLGLNSFLVPGGAASRPLQVLDQPAAPPFTLAADGLFGAAPNQSVRTELSDMDGDGRDDLVVRNAAGLHVRRSTPLGWAAPSGALVPSGTPGDLAVGDFDGDGFGDVVFSSGQVAFGNGGTAWTSGPVLPHGIVSAAVAAGDVDGDGLPDLAFADRQGVVVFRSHSDRTFTAWSLGLPAPGSSMEPAGVQLDDLDGDGRAEIVTLSTTTASRVWRSTVLGQWSLVGTIPMTGAVLAIDIDGDGVKELLLNGVAFAYTPLALVPTLYAAPGPFTRAVALDYDRDGRVDIALGLQQVLSTSASSRLELWRNVGGGQFVAVPLPAAAGFGVLAQIGDIAAGDFDGDTFPDLFAATDQMLTWRNTQTGAGSYGSPCASPGSAAPQIVALGTVGAGQSITLQLTGAIPNECTLLWAGTSRRTWFGQPVLPLDLGFVGAPGCTLLAEPIELVVVIADAAGVALLPIAVPQLPSTWAVSVFAQGAVVDATANALGGVFTSGLALKLQ